MAARDASPPDDATPGSAGDSAGTQPALPALDQDPSPEPGHQSSPQFVVPSARSPIALDGRHKGGNQAGLEPPGVGAASEAGSESGASAPHDSAPLSAAGDSEASEDDRGRRRGRGSVSPAQDEGSDSGILPGGREPRDPEFKLERYMYVGGKSGRRSGSAASAGNGSTERRAWSVQPWPVIPRIGGEPEETDSEAQSGGGESYDGGRGQSLESDGDESDFSVEDGSDPERDHGRDRRRDHGSRDWGWGYARDRGRAESNDLDRRMLVAGLFDNGSPTDRCYRYLRWLAKKSEAVRKWLSQNPESVDAANLVDKIMALFWDEELRWHCLRLFLVAESARDAGGASPSRDPGTTLFAGNPGVGVWQASELYAHLLSELDFASSFKRVQIGQEEQLEQLVEAATTQPIVLLYRAGPSLRGLAALEKFVAESKKLRPRVHIVASYIWTRASEQGAFMDAFPKPSSSARVFLLQDFDKERLRDTLICGSTLCAIDFPGNPDGDPLETALELMTHNRGRPGFRNVIHLRNCLAAMAENYDRRMRRTTKQPRRSGPARDRPVKLAIADVLGETASELELQSAAWKKLDGMVGLDEIKQVVRLHFSQVQYMHYCALQGRRRTRLGLNRLFTGAPGTGKSTVARLYAKVLAELGLVHSDKIVVRRPSQLVASYLGQSEAKTRRAVKQSLGGVLIIDNAEAFFSGGSQKDRGSLDSYRAAIIDTLIGEHQNCRGSDPRQCLTVFLVGHQAAVLELFDTSNPGLAHMFPPDAAFRFPPFSDKHLVELLQRSLEDAGLRATKEAITTAREMLTLARHRPNFGNASAVKALLDSAAARYQARVLTMDMRAALDAELMPNDFDKDSGRVQSARERCDQLFEGFQGMEHIKAQFYGYQDLVRGLRERGIDPRPYVPLAFVFKGPPGTGKTTVARKMASLFYDMGFLSAPEMVECSVAQLAHAPRGVETTFERALGKVLFVDETYLLRNHWGATGDLVDCMTKERFAGKLIVVLAGYDEDMDQLLQANQGLRSRFATSLDFRPMTPTDIIVLLERQVKEGGVFIDGLRPGDRLRRPFVRLLSQLTTRSSWANGRDVEVLARKIIQYAFQAGRQSGDHAAKASIELSASQIIPILATHLGKMIEDEGRASVSAGRQAADKDSSGPASRWL